MHQREHDDAYDYTHGGCYDLALAIHDITGWPIYGQCWMGRYDEDRFDDGDEMAPCYDCEEGEAVDHAVVMTPKGTLLDVLGERAIDDDDRGGQCVAFPVDPSVVQGWVWCDFIDDIETRTPALAGGLVAWWKEANGIA